MCQLKALWSREHGEYASVACALQVEWSTHVELVVMNSH